MKLIQDYRQAGYAVAKGIFTAADVAEMAAEIDRLREEAAVHPTSFRHGNVLYVVQRDARRGPLLRFLQWPSYISPIMEKYRTDPRLLRLIEPLLGRDIKQVINQIIWKAPGDARTQYGYHQDSRFRRPASAYRDLANSFVQTAIAIDPHRPENGCLRLLPGSHRLGELKIAAERSVYEEECSEASLQALGLDPSGMLDLVLEPGDVAIWHPHAIHGSGPNRSAIDRRVYLNGYVRAENCDRGAWAFRDGRPAPLGGPVLIQYEQLFTRPEAHYLEGSPHPYAGD